MFDHPINPFHTSNLADEGRCEKNAYTRRYNTALNLFKSAVIKGAFFRLAARLLRRKLFLYDLDEIKHGLALHGSSYAGVKVVCVSSILGSEGKVAAFDMGFHPLSEASRERWVGMAMAYLSFLPVPPVQLIQVDDVYFVRDGHHRISVARALGQVAVDAEVVSWKASPPFPWQPEAAPKKLYALKRTNLST